MGGNSDDDTSVAEDSTDKTNTTTTDYFTLLSPHLQNIVSSHFDKIKSILLSKKQKLKQRNQPPTNQIPTPITPITAAHCKLSITTAPKPFTAVADSGATDNMSGIKELFEDITYYTTPPQVMLGDEKTFYPILGYGWMRFTTNNKTIRVRALYVPGLGPTTLLSIKQHMKWHGNYFHAEKNSAILAYPSFILQLTVGHEIELPLTPLKDHNNKYDFDEKSAKPATNNKSTQHIDLLAPTIKQYLPDRKDHDQFKHTVQIMKLSPTAVLPSRATKGSIGYDVYTQEEITIQPGSIAKIPTGLASSLPSTMYLRIAPRSSLSQQHITVEGGIIDSDYRGDIIVMLKNNSSVPFTLNKNTKMAQFIFEKAGTPYLHLVTSLPPTTRDKGGFGSTDSKCRRSAFQTFRLNNNYVLHTNNTNPF
jgi:dUTP pyrophosphatase